MKIKSDIYGDVRARIGTRQKHQLEKIARENDRSMSAEIRIAIRKHIARYLTENGNSNA